MNKELRKVLDYCDEVGVTILRFALDERNFIVEQQNGTPSLCSFDEVPGLE